ncbi:MAG TPA: NUDIX domain-containing protein [Candidatus Saccharimonadales bacterium]|nr:NUDIX domain-containing protein [Candidatus Saccharimonadales bacterium]
MEELPRAGASAVAIIETPDSFIVEGRPGIPGELAHSGKIGLFGGHKEADQTPYDAARAELDQELGLYFIGPLQLVEDGDFESENKHGESVVRFVSLFHLAIVNAAGLNMKVPGHMMEIPKTAEAVKAHKERMTTFTFRALYRATTGELPPE